MSISDDETPAPAAKIAEPRKKPTQHKGRAIVTYGRSLIALVIARSLHEKGIEVIGCDDVGMTVLSFSKHVVGNFVHASFEKNEKQALIDLEKAVRKYAPDDDRPYILIPSFRDARLLARHRDRFEPLITIAAPDEASIDLIDPKDQFARFTEKYNLAAPRTQIIAGNEHDGFDPDSISYPVIIKPTDGVGGRGVKKISSPDEMRNYLGEARKSRPLLIQEPVEGQDYCVSVIAEQGELAGIVVYRNERQFPVKSGAGAVRETVDAAPFLETTRDLLKKTGWNGVCEIDFRWNGQPDTPPKLIEVNPRYWAGLFHSTASGVDFPWLAYQLAAGKSIISDEPRQAEIGFKSKTPGAWVLSIVEDIAESDEHFRQSGNAWREMKAHASKGEVIRAAKSLLESAAQGASSHSMLSPLQKELAKHKGLPSEFSVDDDPAVGLGILFALSSLVRHGELPPELKFEADPEADARKEPPAPVKPDGKRPVIGITKPDNGDWLSYQAMKLSVWLAGGKPVRITSMAPRDPHSIDGLLFGGGSDVYPKRYQGSIRQEHRYDLARDEMEASWAEAALKHDIPVLGICRGMQMLNVLQGGTLYPDLREFDNSDYPEDFFHRIFYRKPIRLITDSWLWEHCKASEIRVNSIHTQAIKELGEGFEVAAVEPNGIIQSIEHKTAEFMVGIQFHPEFLIYRKDARAIFRAFVEHARFCRDREAEA